MPALRNVPRRQGRSSARLERREPVAYDREGWEVPVHETLQNLCLSRGNSPYPTPHLSLEHNPKPPSAKSHRDTNTVGSQYLTSSLSFDHGPRRPRAASITSSFSSTSSSSSDLPSSLPTSPMTTSKTRSKPYVRKASSKSDDYVRRPRNAFIIFRSYFNMQLWAHAPTEGPKMNQNNVSVGAGHAWNALSEEEKDHFRRLAKQESDEHKRNHPGYRYAPHGIKKTTAPKSKPTARGKGKKAAKVSDDESDAEFDPESSAPVPGSSPRRSTRIRPSTRRYASPSPSLSPSSRSASPTPSVTHSVSTQESCDEAPTDGENEEFVETENIPELELTPRDLEQEESKVPIFVPTPDLDRGEISAFMDNTVSIFGVGPVRNSKVHGLRSNVHDPFFGDDSPVGSFDMDLQLSEPSPSSSFLSSPADPYEIDDYGANDPWSSPLSPAAAGLMDAYLDTSLCD